MPTVERHVTLPTDLAGAWELLTRPDDLGGWLGAEVRLDPTPGARGLVVDHDGIVRSLVVDRAEEGHVLARRWWTDDARDASRVEITLTPAAEGTRVTVVEQSGARALAVAGAGAAWSHRLLHLEALLLVAAAVRG